jgi:hypothetical protein
MRALDVISDGKKSARNTPSPLTGEGRDGGGQ